MDDKNAFSRRLLIAASCALMLSACDNSATHSAANSATNSTSNQANATAPANGDTNAGDLYRVNPALSHELTKQVPELLIVGADNRCLHYSTGYSQGYFAESLKTAFAPSTSAPAAITDAARAAFAERNPEAVAQVKANLANAAALPEAERAAALNRVLDAAIMAESPATAAVATTCNEHLDEHLSWLVDRQGNPVTRAALDTANAITLVQYRNADCTDCDSQFADIEAFIKDSGITPNILRVTR